LGRLFKIGTIRVDTLCLGQAGLRILEG
jgi:hypothetical protein